MLRFIILYAALFGAFGCASPFLPAFITSRGLAPDKLGIVLGLATALRLICGTLAGRLVDRLQVFRAVLALCALAAGLATLAYLTVDTLWSTAGLTLLQAAALAPLVPLADALTLAHSGNPQKGFEYGWVRGAGSAAFIAGAVLAGYAAGAYQLAAVIWLSAAGLFASALCTLLVPPFPGAAIAPQGTRSGQAWRMLLRSRAFVWLTVTAALVLGSHAMHDSFAVIRWLDAGISPASTGLLWSEAVAAEVLVFFFLGPRLLRALGPVTVLTVAAAAGVLRWTVMALTAQVGALALIQPLHGLTFALLHLACMRLIGVTVPSNLAATGQAFYGLIGVGGATAVLTVVSGSLYGRYGAGGFWCMALLCVLAFPAIWLLQNSLAVSEPEQHH
ncbi:MAG: MFS transporter [Xanthobacteraceae bacterium]